MIEPWRNKSAIIKLTKLRVRHNKKYKKSVGENIRESRCAYGKFTEVDDSPF